MLDHAYCIQEQKGKSKTNWGLKNFHYWQYSGRALLQIGTMHDLDKN